MRRTAGARNASSGPADAALLDQFVVAGATGGYLHDEKFPRRSFATPKTASGRKWSLRRPPDPLLHPASRLRRRPRAQPHAVRVADDSHQPRDHRRRAQAGVGEVRRVPARRRVRRRHGRRLRRPRRRRHPDRRNLRHHQLVAVVQRRNRRALRRPRARDVRRHPDRLRAFRSASPSAAAAPSSRRRPRWGAARCSRAPAWRRS